MSSISRGGWGGGGSCHSFKFFVGACGSLALLSKLTLFETTICNFPKSSPGLFSCKFTREKPLKQGCNFRVFFVRPGDLAPDSLLSNVF